MSIPGLRIRPGTSEDMASAHALVMELARYENAPEEVVTSPEIFSQDGFGAHAAFQILVAEQEEMGIMGIALYYFGYSTWKGRMIYLDDLVVTESLRGKGIGGKLFDALVEVAGKAGVSQLRWQVLDWNEPAIRFYQKLGAGMDGEWINCSLSRDQIQSLTSTKDL